MAFPIRVGFGGFGPEHLFMTVRGEGGGLHDIAHHPSTFDHGLQIAFVGQKVGINGGRGEGVRAVKANGAAAFGP